jgi:hypothetical protein
MWNKANTAPTQEMQALPFLFPFADQRFYSSNRKRQLLVVADVVPPPFSDAHPTLAARISRLQG